jgi:hypothetical protein
MPTDYEDWIGIATAAWFAPAIATVAMLDWARLAMKPVPARSDTKIEAFEVPCPDEELFA